MKVALVCIAKMEDNYIEEWVLYNKKLGFDDIFIYENDWECSLEFPFLKKIPFPGKKKQMESYKHFTDNFRNEYDWVAFFDCDEFLVLKKNKNIHEFLTEYDNPNGIGINWKYFGSNGKLKRDENKNSLLKQFVLSSKISNHHVKTILKLNSNGFMILPHNPNIPIMNTNREFFKGPFNKPEYNDVAQLNHYHHKTLEDWLIRCERGQADSNKIQKPEQWESEKYNNCDVEDLDAYNFMYKN